MGKFDEMVREMRKDIEQFTWGGFDDPAEAERKIASALRQVERETLERAAKEVREYCGLQGWDDGYLHDLEDDIRALSPTPTEDVSTNEEPEKSR